MPSFQPFGRYDQGFFNVACALVDELAARSHLHFLCELDACGMDQVRQEAKANGRPPPTYGLASVASRHGEPVLKSRRRESPRSQPDM